MGDRKFVPSSVSAEANHDKQNLIGSSRRHKVPVDAYGKAFTAPPIMPNWLMQVNNIITAKSLRIQI